MASMNLSWYLREFASSPYTPATPPGGQGNPPIPVLLTPSEAEALLKKLQEEPQKPEKLETTKTGLNKRKFNFEEEQ